MQRDEGWEAVDARMRVVSLSRTMTILVPALLVAALPIGTRGVSYDGGKLGMLMGLFLLGGSFAIGLALYPLSGIIGLAIPVWLIGSAGVVLIANGTRPIAFIKPICVQCRLLPIIREHEAIHIAGVGGERQVWDLMKKRHSAASLGLAGDPGICWFCPIPKRLKEE